MTRNPFYKRFHYFLRNLQDNEIVDFISSKFSIEEGGKYFVSTADNAKFYVDFLLSVE